MDAIAKTRGLRGVMVPKAEDTAEVATVARYLSGLPIVALIETARGVHDAVALAQLPSNRGRLVRLGILRERSSHRLRGDLDKSHLAHAAPPTTNSAIASKS
jgi:citrate lyase beta subunit